MPTGFLAGLIDAIAGGGGLISLPAYIMAGIPMHSCIATNLSALVVFLLNGQVILHLGIISGLFNIAGSYIGASLFASKGSKIVKPAIILVLVLFFVKVLLD